MADLFPMIGTFFLVILILFLSYYFSRYVGGRVNRLQKSKFINILDRIVIGQDRYLLVIQIGQKICLISSSVSETRLLMELKSEDLQIEENDILTNEKAVPNFKDIISKLKNSKKN